MKNNIIRQNIVVCFIAVFLLGFMTLGYASFNEELAIESKVKLNSSFDIDSIILETDYRYVSNSINNGVILSVSIENEDDNQTTLKVKNTSDEMVTYKGNKVAHDNEFYPIITGLLPGDFLLPKEEKIIYIKDFSNNALGNMLIDLEFLYNAINIKKPVIITNIDEPNINIIDNTGILSVDIMNLYDSSIELSIYLNDDDLGVSLDNNKLLLNKGESKRFDLNIIEDDLVSDVSTTLYAKVLSNTKSDDIYVIGNIMLKKDA